MTTWVLDREPGTGNWRVNEFPSYEKMIEFMTKRASAPGEVVKARWKNTLLREVEKNELLIIEGRKCAAEHIIRQCMK